MMQMWPSSIVQIQIMLQVEDVLLKNAIKYHRWFILPLIPIIMKYFQVSKWDTVSFYFFIPLFKTMRS